ncbi:hypothetical protein BGX31_005298 [Mortierella sp. GBA43]|nr:hypothetical protein BGX31_005298 [Mortierella sp. GBA43]
MDNVTPSLNGSSITSKPTANCSEASLATADANFRAGIELIQQAYEDKYQALVEEVNTWKWISEEKTAQMAVMSTELARVQESYTALQKEMAQLETFRKAIVTMVDQHSGGSLTQLERSILETIEADVENAVIDDADTSSFMLDDDADQLAASPCLPLHFTTGKRYPQKSTTASSSTVSLALPKSSPSSIPSRPRASSEVSSLQMKIPGRTQNSSNRTMFKSGYNPSTHGSSNGLTVLSGSLKELKGMQKSESADNLRNKRNTISTSTRSLNPYSSRSIDNAIKRHTSVSPLLPRTRSTTAIATSKSSFSPKSTPSSPPQQPSSAPSSSFADSMATRAGNQNQQLKDYSLGVKSSMARLASLSGVTGLVHGDISQSPTQLSAGPRRLSGSVSTSQASRQIHRSSSDILSRNQTSSVTAKSQSQQEEQQLDETQSSAPKSSSRSRRRSHHHHTDDDDEYRLSVAHEQEWSSVNEGIHPHQRAVSDQVYGSTTRQHGSGDSLNYDREEPQRRQSKSSLSGQRRESTPEHKHSEDKGGVDATAFTTLYKEIRDSMDAVTFGMFAAVVAAFNEGEKSTEETLEEVSTIVKDRSLNQRFRDLIHKAIAEKENQPESDVGNDTLDGDQTLDLDLDLDLNLERSPLPEDDEMVDGDHGHDHGEDHDDYSSISHPIINGSHPIQDINDSFQHNHIHGRDVDQDLSRGLEESDRRSKAKETATRIDKGEYDEE